MRDWTSDCGSLLGKIIMNERIRELADQAGFILHQMENLPDFYIFNKEKFAELIVMECMTICEELGDVGLDGHYCADKINKTFRS